MKKAYINVENEYNINENFNENKEIKEDTQLNKENDYKEKINDDLYNINYEETKKNILIMNILNKKRKNILRRRNTIYQLVKKLKKINLKLRILQRKKKQKIILKKIVKIILKKKLMKIILKIEMRIKM